MIAYFLFVGLVVVIVVLAFVRRGGAADDSDRAEPESESEKPD